MNHDQQQHPAAGRTRFEILDDALHSQMVDLDDPRINGRQVAAAADIRPLDNAIVLRHTEHHELQSVAPDELVTLDPARLARFFVVAGDRMYLFSLDDTRSEWGTREISREVLLCIADRDDRYDVVLELANQPDRVLRPGERVALDGSGVERFTTRLRVGPRLVSVRYGEVDFEFESGVYTTEQLRTRFGVPTDWDLFPIAPDGQFGDNLVPCQVVSIQGGEHFGAHLGRGQSS